VTDNENGGVDFPVDDATYNLLQTLTSKLEALDAYSTYLDDADEQDAGLYQQLVDEDRRAAERLFQALKDRLAGS
jgi:hypothetical protein